MTLATGWTRRATLTVILLSAGILRFRAVGLGHDPVPFLIAPGHAVPVVPLSFQIDEGHNTWIPTTLSWRELNPHAFYLPSLFWYLLFALDQGVFWVGKAYGSFTTWAEVRGAVEGANPAPFFLLGRSLNAVLGTATVGLVAVLGRRLWTPTHGLLAAAFLAGAFLHVRDSALATTDAPTAFFVVLALLGAAGVLKHGRVRDYLLAAGGAGLATATKYNAVLVLVALVVAHGLRWARGTPGRRPVPASRLLGAGLLAGAVFLVCNPYLMLDWRGAQADLLWNYAVFEQGRFVDVGPGWWYHLAVSLRYGLGLALLGLALVGLVWTLWSRDAGGWMLGSFAGVFYVVVAQGRLLHVRYMTPLIPVCCLLAAAGLQGVARRFPWPPARAWLVGGIAVLAILEPLHSVAGYTRLIHHVDTRVEAYEFLLTLPPDSEVATYGPSEVWRSVIPRWEPTYYARDPRQTWDDVLAVLKARQIRYLLVHTSGLEVFSPPLPDLERTLAPSATLLHEFRPDRSGTHSHPVYDWSDPFYVPIAGFQGLVRPGPHVRVYRLE